MITRADSIFGFIFGDTGLPGVCSDRISK